MKRAAICTIGDEILIGQIVDTNSAILAIRLNETGIKVNTLVSVGDNREDILQAVNRLSASHDIVILTGGLGPTKDDITKAVLAEVSGSDGYVFHEGQMRVIEAIVRGRGVGLSELNRDQAMVPSKAEVIVNERGTAPCMVFNLGNVFAHNPRLYSLPGVPFEVEGLLTPVIQDIRKHFETESIYHRTIDTYGIAESVLSKRIESWEMSLPKDIRLAYLPNPLNGVRLRLSIYGGDAREEMQRINNEFEKLRPVLGNAIYGEGEDTLASVVARLLKQMNRTLSVAESCTGGRIASLLTALPGASEYFYGSVTSYDNSVKSNVLGVSSEILDTYGAVSWQCAEAMALGVRRLCKTDYAVATTGIAGPGGGTENKPVGTVWIAVAGPGTATELGDQAVNVTSKVFNFNNIRSVNIERFAASALNMLRLVLVGE